MASRFAAITDVHGNLPALEAVLDDIRRRNVDVVVNLGDHVSGPLWPRETAASLMRQRWTQISGNCDRQVVRRPPSELGASDRFAYEQLTAEQRTWLAVLPDRASPFEDVLLFHGAPDDDDAYLLESVDAHGVRLASYHEIEGRLKGISAPLMLCGHTHHPRCVRVNDALVVNPGSVGLPAYEHDEPSAHVIECGSPHARYAVLERAVRGWIVDLIAVPYDHHAAAARAERNGRPDWVVALRTGFMTPPARFARTSANPGNPGNSQQRA
ncbi:MAG TPA: metallophosphoesterase family protein [Gemmatimonadaceae bacterium]|nr:metallophosphoesterase family protein [Gemmatimonadaceae bacterium]